jgi:hypothetical protein
MIGGLMKSTSLYALVASAGLALSLGSASAADLGGNCCADLEERVAELEATAAKKGTRKTSLTVWGQVHRTIMSWRAPTDTFGVAPAVSSPTSGTYLGLDNTNSATRFGFRGDAKINAEWTAGYSITIDVFTGGTTFRATRNSEDGTNVSGSTSRFDDHLMRMRDANWWLQSDRIGRFTMGRLTGAGAIATIDLGGIGNVASSGVSLAGGNLSFANGRSIAQVTDQAGDFGYRQDGVRWDSPTIQGFVLSASIGETLRESVVGATGPAPDGRVWGVALRYANEFNGVRIAAGIGYEKAVDEASTPVNTDAVNFGGSLALLHVATGLFVQGDIMRFERTPVAGGPDVEGDRWMIQGGITRNWFGIGNTALYGEYGRHNLDAGLFGTGGLAAAVTAANTKAEFWGLGMAQTIDAAAMQLYAGYRRHSLEEGAVGQGNVDIFIAGARINF